MTLTKVSCQNTQLHIHNENMHIKILSAHIQYHDFDNKDLLTVRDKYTALLQQELQNPYWNLHDQKL